VVYCNLIATIDLQLLRDGSVCVYRVAHSLALAGEPQQAAAVLASGIVDGVVGP
jgi:hypothetical protein